MVAGKQETGFTLKQLLADLSLSKVDLPAKYAEVLVRGISLDSRLVEPGYVFIACPGERSDGREFITEVLGKGAIAVLAEAEGLDSIAVQDKRVIPVPSLSVRVSAIAGYIYGHPSRSMKLTGVTGTNGKTTCVNLLAQLYALLGRAAGAVGTLGCEVMPAGFKTAVEQIGSTGMTTADAVTNQVMLANLRDAEVEYVAMEVSSHGLAQNRVDDVSFDTAIFTNLSRDHLDYHIDMTAYLAAKARLFHMPGLKRAVVNADDPVGRELADQLAPEVECLRYGIKEVQGAEILVEVRAENARYDTEGIVAQLITPWGEGELRSTLLGRFNLSNLLAVITTVCGQGFDFHHVLEVVPQLQAVAGRMQVLSGSEVRVVVDYAHTPDALEQSLKVLSEHSTGRLWCVFGCGGDRDPGKRGPMGEVAANYADYTVISSDNPRSEAPRLIIEDILKGIPPACNVLVDADRRAAIRIAIGRARPGDTVLIAGKGHEQYQEVDGVRWPFDDVGEARLALSERRRAQLEGEQ